MRLLYNTIARIGFCAASPLIAWKALTRPRYREGFAQRLGLGLPRLREKTIWIHAVSVGEVMAAEGLVREIAARDPGRLIVLTVTTPTGRDVASKKLRDHAEVLYFPYDLQGAARRAVSAINPAVFAMVDTEIWPNVIWACNARGARVVMVNGRISDRSYPRYRRLRWFFRRVLSDVSLLLMQGETDAERIIDIGADPSRVETVGNMKFDGLAKGVTEEERMELRRSIGIGPAEKVAFLGSVHEGEEAAVRGALKAMENAGGARLVIAPRRIEEIGWIERALSGSGLDAVRKTSLPPRPEIDPAKVPVMDTFGELAKFYSIADVAFVGGSLIEHGGQNPLEPAAHGVAPAFGPSMSNFRDASRALLDAGGAWTVSSEAETAALFTRLLMDDGARARAGEAARGVVEKNRGAAARVAGRILELAR